MTTTYRTTTGLALLIAALSSHHLFAAGNPDNIYCSPAGQPQFGSSDGTAKLPQSCFYTAMSGTPSPGQVISVPSGGNVTNALASASCGDIIELASGGSFTPFTLPAKNCDASHWITIRTSAYASLPSEGTRINPCYAGVASLPGRPDYSANCPAGGAANLMAKITTPNSGTVFTVTSGANYYRFIGLEFTRSAPSITYNLMILGGSDHLIFDRVWAHGDPLLETTRAMTVNDAHHIAVIDSYFDDFHCTAITGTCTDAQAIAGGNNSIAGVAGTYKIVNNFLESSAENILFGGGHSADVVADIEVRRNHLFKPMTWNPSDPNFIGTKFIVKNNFELKNGQRILLEGNILENTWGGFSQVGAHILLTPKNQDGRIPGGLCPLCAVNDITIRYDYLTHGAQALQMGAGANDSGFYANGGNDYSIHDIVADASQYPTCYGCGIVLNQLGAGQNPPLNDVLHNVTVNHMTQVNMARPLGYLAMGGALAGTGYQIFNVNWMNSIYDAGTAGPYSTGGGLTNCASTANSPLGKFNACWQNYNVTGNVLAGGLTITQQPTWPLGNFFPADMNGVGFAKLNGSSGGDYHLCHGAGNPAGCTAASPYVGKGNDGRDPGADIDMVSCMTNGVRTGAPNAGGCNPVIPTAPSLTSISPTSTVAGSAGFTLTATGSNFVNGSLLEWNSSTMTTTFVNSTQLTMTVPASFLLIPSTANISVNNPPPNPGLSNALKFFITPNPGAPVITQSTTVFTGVGQPFAYLIQATNNPTSYDATPLPVGLVVDTHTGIISGIPTVVKVSNLNLYATNAAGIGTAPLVLAVVSTDTFPNIISAKAASGTVGVFFSYRIVATSSPVSYGASPLPPGLSVSTFTGVISGTPTVQGVYSLTLSATNNGGTGTGPLVIHLAPGSGSPVITSPLTAVGVLNSSFSYQIQATNIPTVYGSTLPVNLGLIIDTITGTITGSPTRTGNFNIPIWATNGVGTGTATLTLTVDPSSGVPFFTSPTSATGQVGVFFVFQASATNTPTGYGATNLPASLLLVRQTGVISGTPTIAGLSIVNLSAANAVGTGTSTLTLTILPTSTTNQAPVVNAGPNQTITLPASAILSGTATDDGLPNPPGVLTITWSQMAGPGIATFANPNSASTSVSFSTSGVYILLLSASDSILSSSASVQITVNAASTPPPVLPSTPTLSLPAFLPLNATIDVGYTGTDPASYFQWSFTPVTQIPAGSLASSKAIAASAPSASFTTSSPRANLAGVSLGVGPYLVAVKVFDNNGVPSAPAQAYVTMVPADLSGVRVYPNPWRSNKHTSVPITFDNLTLNTTIKIFTVSGHWVKTLPISNSSATWDLTNDSGDKVASGLYVYLMTTDQGSKKTGQIAVIK